METKEKIGVGIITCNRPNYLKDCLNSVDYNLIDCAVVINDGKELDSEIKSFFETNNIHYILNETNLGVGKSKNKALRYLLDKNCSHLFLLEEDCIIQNNEIWNKYIKAYEQTNIPHFNYGPGSPWNRVQPDPTVIGNLHKRHLSLQTTKPNPRLIIEYSSEVKLALYEHIVGMFAYFHSSILKEIGLMDEKFFNAWEHVEHTYRIIKAKKYTPFWWFADIADSADYIKEAKNEKANTSLAKDEHIFIKLVQEGLAHFQNIHGLVPSQIKSATKEEVVNLLKQIKNESK